MWHLWYYEAIVQKEETCKAKCSFSHQTIPFYDKEWENLNSYHPDNVEKTK